MPLVWLPKDRQSNDASKQDPAPSPIVSQFNTKLSLGSSSSDSGVVNKIYKEKNDKPKPKNIKFVYGNKATTMWFSVGLANHYHIPSSLELKEVSAPSALRWGNKPLLVLVNNQVEMKTSTVPKILLLIYALQLVKT